MVLLHAAAQVARALGFERLPVAAKKYLKSRDPNFYREPPGPRQALGAECFAPVSRERSIQELDQPAGDFWEHWRGVPGGHKWLHYFAAYEELLAPFRARPIRLLEIGVYRGASLATWRKNLHPQSVIVGVDIDPTCRDFDNPAQQVHVRIGSQADGAFLAEVAREFGPFDVIIDDGSHVCSHMIASFGYLFLPALADTGIYIAEDTHTNFFPAYRDQPYSFIDLCKDLVDLTHAHYALQPAEIDYRVDHALQVPALEVSRLSAQIREIRFRDSIIAIQKQPVGRLPGSVHN